MLTKHNTQDQSCTLLKTLTVFFHIVYVKVAFSAENQNIFQIKYYSRLHSRQYRIVVFTCAPVKMSKLLLQQYICWGWAELSVQPLSMLPHGSQHGQPMFNVVWISLDTVNVSLFFHGLQVYLSLSLPSSTGYPSHPTSPYSSSCNIVFHFWWETVTLTCCLFIVLTPDLAELVQGVGA